MALADLLKTFKDKEEDKLINELDRYLMYRSGPDIGRPYEYRIEGFHHPSVLSSVQCDRRYIYSWIDAKRSNPSNNAKGQRIFNTGNDFGYRMQGYLYELGVLIGEWLCISCTFRWLDLEHPSPKCCPKCGTSLEIWYNLHYLEIPLIDEETKMAGKADAGVIKGSKRTLWEFKTIKNKDAKTSPYANCFEGLISPLDHHQIQFNLYLYLANKLYGLENNDFIKGGFIYQSKNNQDWKEFPVALIPETVERVKVRKEVLESIITSKTLPPRMAENKSDRNCRYCEWLDLCWETDHNFTDIDRRDKNE